MQEPLKIPFPARELNIDPAYEKMREEQPVTRVRLPYGEDGWLVTRYADVRTVLANPCFSRSASVGRDHPRVVLEPQTFGIIGLDPPEHTKLRSLAAWAFTHRRAEQLRPRAMEVANRLAGDMSDRGQPADLVEQFSVPFTHSFISEMLGVPPEDQPKFRTWSESALSTAKGDQELSAKAGEQMWEYLDALIAARTREPADDLITNLVETNREKGYSIEDLVILTMMILVAGYETTSSHISNFSYVLMKYPQKRAQLLANPELIDRAVEELLRWAPLETAPGPPRYTTADVELAGVAVPADEAVLVDIAAANHDPSAFPDPGKLDFHRTPNQHVAFGHGAHHCIGAQIARMMLQVALTCLLNRFPTMQLAVPENKLEWRVETLSRGLKALPVRW